MRQQQQYNRYLDSCKIGQDTQLNNHVRCDRNNLTRTVSNNKKCSTNMNQVRWGNRKNSICNIYHVRYVGTNKNLQGTLPNFKTIYYFRINHPKSSSKKLKIPHSDHRMSFLCYVRISEQTATIFLHSISLVFNYRDCECSLCGTNWI
jgi:hypothetical protein